VSSFQISNTVPNCTPSGEHLGEREASAAAIFCDSDLFAADYHPTFQQISFPDQETAKCGDRRLNHGDGEARAVLQVAKERGVSVLVGLGGMDEDCRGDQEDKAGCNVKRGGSRIASVVRFRSAG
jgi:hypothetical protein